MEKILQVQVGAGRLTKSPSMAGGRLHCAILHMMRLDHPARRTRSTRVSACRWWRHCHRSTRRSNGDSDVTWVRTLPNGGRTATAPGAWAGGRLLLHRWGMTVLAQSLEDVLQVRQLVHRQVLAPQWRCSRCSLLNILAYIAPGGRCPIRRSDRRHRTRVGRRSMAVRQGTAPRW